MRKLEIETAQKDLKPDLPHKTDYLKEMVWDLLFERLSRAYTDPASMSNMDLLRLLKTLSENETQQSQQDFLQTLRTEIAKRDPSMQPFNLEADD